MNNKDIDLACLVLPREVFEHFELVDIVDNNHQLDLILDEKSAPPSPRGYSSKGFTERIVIQDFPLRGKPVFLHIRRRKWQNNKTLEMSTNKYDLAHLGTKITREFADFLKG
ncbi:MAG: hypothetical protein RR455_13010, partial [Bacteroidales bacterium]